MIGEANEVHRVSQAICATIAIALLVLLSVEAAPDTERPGGTPATSEAAADPTEGLPELTPAEMASKPYFGINVAVSEPLPDDDRYDSEFGIFVLWVHPAFPAWAGGLRGGDIIIEFDDEKVASFPQGTATTRFINWIRSLEPGATARLLVLRWKSRVELFRDGDQVAAPEAAEDFQSFIQSMELSRDYVLRSDGEYELLEVAVDVRRPPNIRALLPDEFAREPEQSIQSAAHKLIEAQRIVPEYQDLVQRFQRISARPDPFRLAIIDYIQNQPFALKPTQDSILAQMTANSGQGQQATNFLALATALMGQPSAVPTAPPLKTGLSVDQHMAQISEVLSRGNELWAEAYRKLSKEDLEFLWSHLAETLVEFRASKWKLAGAGEGHYNNYRVIELASRVDVRPLIEGALQVLRLAEPRYVNGLRDDFRQSSVGLTGKVLASEATPFGTVSIHGVGDDTHAIDKENPTAVIIDLGGNDVYLDRVASSTAQLPISVVVDASGDDAYQSSADFSTATGFLGIGLLGDIAGNDSYIGLLGSQGSAFLGVGVLLDFAGDDTYRGHSYTQGCSFAGAAALIDLGGTDRYEAAIYSQGVGIAGGVAALFDSQGDDRYFAKGHSPSAYGTQGAFQGWSQGVGLGVRHVISGGVGILHDGGGKNTFEAGEFSQGGGYYYGWGILDSRGDEQDTYVVGRYGLGFAAHQAIGSFDDSGGDDRYYGRDGVVAGAAWDRSIAWFEDDAGKDQYRTKQFSRGASAHNSIAVFVDRQGNQGETDYESVESRQVNDYWGGASLSLVFELDGAESQDCSSSDSVRKLGQHTFVLKHLASPCELAED